MSTIRAATCVEILVLTPIQAVNAEALKFKVVILRWSQSEYSCELWRREHYKIPPSFQDNWKEPSDVELEVLDHGIAWRDLRGATAQEIREALLQVLEAFFSVKISRPA